MQPDASASSDLIYGLDDRPKPLPALLAALQHVLASFVGIITPPLIIGSALGLGAYLPYLISMALMVSGVGTFIQARRPFGIGAGVVINETGLILADLHFAGSAPRLMVTFADGTRSEADIVGALPPHLVQFERFANCGHAVVPDAPEQAMAIIRGFIQHPK